MPISHEPLSKEASADIQSQLKSWTSELGFNDFGVTDIDLSAYEPKLKSWLQSGYHGEMSYMASHGSKRYKPAELVAGTRRIIVVRMDYLKPVTPMQQVLDSPSDAYISRYTLGRDYHKVIRRRLARLADKLQHWADAEGRESYQRVFTDSAPVMEKSLAEKAGLGWIGKNTLLINRKAGSWFFLGAVYTSLPIPVTQEQHRDHCGSCNACQTICPTDAIIAPYVLDARRCISYLTIEHKGSIPVDLRDGIGNRVFGCDDCQLVCPWNRYARFSHESDFEPRHKLDHAGLVELFEWDEQTFLTRTEGSAIRRTGYQGWQRNLSVALGNAGNKPGIAQALTERLKTASDLVAEHIRWALEKLD